VDVIIEKFYIYLLIFEFNIYWSGFAIYKTNNLDHIIIT